MQTVEEIQAAIDSLSPEVYARLREWFVERDWEQWDRSKTRRLARWITS
jgi:hypothetical protein